MNIIIDKREKCNIIPEILKDMGVQVDYQQIPVGDYLLCGETAIERKTTRDFVNSLKDKRIFNQIKNLKQYKTPILLVEGEEDLFSNSNFNPNALRGLLLSIYLDFNVPVIRTKNEAETALWLYSLIKRNEKDKKEINTRNGIKPKCNNQLKIHAVSSLPEVGVNLSKRILKEYKTLQKVFSLKEEELMNIPGVGKKKAQKIVNLLGEEYNEKE